MNKSMGAHVEEPPSAALSSETVMLPFEPPPLRRFRFNRPGTGPAEVIECHNVRFEGGWVIFEVFEDSYVPKIFKAWAPGYALWIEEIGGNTPDE